MTPITDPASFALKHDCPRPSHQLKPQAAPKTTHVRERGWGSEAQGLRNINSWSSFGIYASSVGTGTESPHEHVVGQEDFVRKAGWVAIGAGI